MAGLGRMLIIFGIVIAVFGVLVALGDKLPFRLGRLPGDITYQGKNTVVYFPLATSILISVVLSLVLAAFGRK